MTQPRQLNLTGKRNRGHGVTPGSGSSKRYITASRQWKATQKLRAYIRRKRWERKQLA